MKRSRIITAVAATAVVAGSAFLGTGIANAAVSPFNADGSDAAWVNSAADLGTESPTTGYPTTGWFTGDTGVAPQTAFSASGVTLTGPTQLLTATSEPGTDLQELVTTADFLSTGAADFQIPLFTNTAGAGSDSGFGTLFPNDFGDSDFAADGGGLWQSTVAIGNIPARTTATIAAFQAQITAAAPNTELIGYGFITTAGTSTVTAVQFGGDTTYFTPDPDGTYTPTAGTIAQVTSTGIHVVASGFFPGETIDVGFIAEDAQSGGPIDGLTLTADANGSVDAQVVIPASAVTAAGNYTLVLVGETSNIALTNTYAVAANPVTPIAPVPTPIRTAATFAG